MMAAAGRNPTKVKVLELAVVTAAAKAAGAIVEEDAGRTVDVEAVAIRIPAGGAMMVGTGDPQRIATKMAGTPWQRL